MVDRLVWTQLLARIMGRVPTLLGLRLLVIIPYRIIVCHGELNQGHMFMMLTLPHALACLVFLIFMHLILTTSGSNINTTQYGSHFDNDDSYILMSVGTTSWCLDSGATHYVCRKATALHESTLYSGTSPLLVGDGSPTTISCVGSSIFPTTSKMLHLSNVLCVLNIRKNLLSVSQFAKNNNVCFELHSSYCIVKDIPTWEILLRGHTLEGLYYFSPVTPTSSVDAPSVHNTRLQPRNDNDDVFALWHCRIAQANLPMDYWGYAFYSVVHLINRLPTPILKGQSPYQVLYGHEPTYDHLRVFGCCCFPYLRLFAHHKLEFRSQPNTFLGVKPSPSISTYVPLVQSIDSSLAATIESSTNTSSSPPRCSFMSSPSGGSFAELDSTHEGFRLSTSADVGGSSALGIAPSALLSVPLGNTYTMITRSKVEIFKPKALSVEAIDYEPRTIEEALDNPEWRLAVQAEFDAFVANSTWELVSLPHGRKVIGCKWFFKVKKNPDGTIARRNARLVAKGCSQVPRCDFKETFSPMVKPATIRTILTVAVSRGWQLHQSGSAGEQLVCHLTKALYGLRQLPRAWFDKLKRFLVNTDFLLVTTESVIYVLVYVDDITVTGSTANSINGFIQMLHNEFSLKDMGDLHYFLDIEVTRSSTGKCPHANNQFSALSKDEGERFVDPTKYRIHAYAYFSSFGALKENLTGLDSDDHRSTSGYCVLAAATSDITWLVSLLTELQIHSTDSSTVWCDNSSAIVVATNPVLHSKFKHVELDLFFVREKVADGSLVVGEVLALD
ncbi:Retrovirus-related Pol polyprotein from transposon TNT 1-94 [Gossypium australe]|uniref:Retrovirus-related Pol polyprotein from transposon TNT 1-94 n=1 Tax=Gossypium australe TaxID=47621 RepID=A0A5B6WFE2_9ROSI|nr:Retrovirus-related Pol polyprotein from transposon TNT 1-94 [Gossypium australe]